MKQTIDHHPLSLESAYQMREACLRGLAALASSVSVVKERIELSPDVLATNAPEEIERLGAGIAGLSLPSEYQGEYGLRLPEFTAVGFTSSSSQTQLDVMQFTSENPTSLDELEVALEQDLVGNSQVGPLGIVRQDIILLYGRHQVLTVYQTSREHEESCRVALAQFEGPSGPALLVLSHWHAGELDYLLSALQ